MQVTVVGAGAAPDGRESPAQRQASASPLQDDEVYMSAEEEAANLPPEVAALLLQKGLQQLSGKQRKWHEMKVRCSPWLLAACTCCSC